MLSFHPAPLLAALLFIGDVGITQRPAPAPGFTDLDCRVDGPASVCSGQALLYTSAFAGTNYVWSFTSNTAGAAFCGPTNQQSVCVTTTQAGAFRLQLNYTLPSGPKSCAAEVSVAPALSIVDLGPQTACVGEEVMFATAILSGNGPFTYAWTVDYGTGPQPIAGANTDVLILSNLALADAGTYCVTVGGTCGPVQSCATLTVEDCGGGGGGHCSLTQGAYGSAGGFFNGLSTIDLLNQLLSTDLVVGKPGRSVRILAGAGDCVLQRLPANSGAATLPAVGDATLGGPSCQTGPVALPLKNGRFKNVFLGQVVTLSLNTRLDSTLAEVGLCESMTTQTLAAGPDGLLGTEDDVVDPGLDLIPGTADDLLTVSISSSVIDALGSLGLPITVGGLLELANRGLAAQPTGGATLSDLNSAVDAINNAFDECRLLIECQ